MRDLRRRALREPAPFPGRENTWEDKLTICNGMSRWPPGAGIQVACGIDHVEELVIHWMTTGSLDYPFARSALGATGWRRSTPVAGRVDLSGARPIGELAVHRESVERVLAENPQSLKVVLDALLDALRQEITIEAEPVIAPGSRTSRRRIVWGFHRAEL